MPRGYCKDYRLQNMEARLKKLLSSKKISQISVAKEFGITQGMVSRKLKTMDITLPEMMKIIDMTNADGKDVLRIFSLEDKV